MGFRYGLGLALASALLLLAPAAAQSAPMATSGPAHRIAPGVFSRAVSFTSDGRKVTGEIISGPAKGPHPGILFVHWLGDPKTTNHTEFEADAIALARRGATSLLVDTLWAAPDWFDKVGTSAPEDIKQAQGQVADLRTALDVLEGQKGVDPRRIAYVGHDFGAMFGALLAGEDARPRVYVLMAGVPTLSEWYLLGKPHPAGYAEALDKLDVTGSLAKSKARAFLFQFAAHDRYIAADRAAALVAAAPLPHGVFVYDADHSLAVPQAFADRQAWLGEQLFGSR